MSATEQRKHQRIRFGVPPVAKLGYGGLGGQGLVENLSMSGIMIRTDLELKIGRSVGCEFAIGRASTFDAPLSVVSRLGDLYGLRFQAGLISQILIEDGISAALESGAGATLSVHELGGIKVMRINGGLNGELRNDFMHALTRVGVEEIDLGGVTTVDQAGLALCLVAHDRHGVRLGAQSPCFAAALRQALVAPGPAAWENP